MKYFTTLRAAATALALAVMLALAIDAVDRARAITPYDSTKTPPVRQLSTQQVHYWRFVVNFNDPLIGSTNGQQVARIGQNAFIDNVEVEIVTAFNATSTNLLTVGTTTANLNELVASADLVGNNSSSLGTQVARVTRGFGRSLTAAGDTSIYVKYAQTGTAASTGQAIVIVTYIPNNDE